MQLVQADEIPWSEREERHREGSLAFRNLFRGDEGDPNNFRLVLSRNGGEYRSPRHRHNFDQIRYCVKGSANIAPGKTLNEGDIGYFPEGCYYGPQFDGGQNRVTLVMQLGGASGLGYMSSAQLRRGLEALEQTGIFAGGKFTPNGGNEPRDSYEAIWEHIFARPIEYPEGRYEDPVLIRAAAFDWKAHATHEGVMVKPLGVFSERELRLSFARLSANAVLPLESAAAMTLIHVIGGEGRCALGPLRAGSTLRLEQHETLDIHGKDALEMLLIAVPVVSAKPAIQN